MLNVGIISFFFALDNFNILEWDISYAVPIGVSIGIGVSILTIKIQKQKQKDKELESLR